MRERYHKFVKPGWNFRVSGRGRAGLGLGVGLGLGLGLGLYLIIRDCDGFADMARVVVTPAAGLLMPPPRL